VQELKESSSTPRAGRPATRTALLDAMQRLLERDGLAACTSTAVAAEAGLSAGTFYTYFEDRSAALAALFEDRLDQIVAAVAAALTSDRLLDEGLEATVDAAVGATIEQYRHHAPVLRAALASVQTNQRIRAVYWDRHGASVTQVQRFLKRAAAAGMVRPDGHRALAHTLLLLLQGLNNPVVLAQSDRRLVAAIRRTLVAAIADALRPEPI
jgi:AcrR family transcriptional regulator